MVEAHRLGRGAIEYPDDATLRIPLRPPAVDSYDYPVAGLPRREVTCGYEHIFLSRFVRDNEAVPRPGDLEPTVHGLEASRETVPSLALTEYFSGPLHVAEQPTESAIVLLGDAQPTGQLSRAERTIAPFLEVCENSLSVD